MNPMFSSLGVTNVDHYAVTTKDLVATLNDFLSVPGARLLRGPGENPAQQVNYAFVELNGMGVVEILSPLTSESPIMNHLQSAGGAYHLCYAVRDLDNAIEIAQRDFGTKLVVEPREDGAFDGRRVAFLVHPLHGLFELLEAYPTSTHISTAPYEPQKTEQSFSSDNQLLKIYQDIVDASASNFSAINMEDCPDWDSFKHLIFIMEIEKRFEINIPANVMGELNSLQKIDAYLASK